MPRARNKRGSQTADKSDGEKGSANPPEETVASLREALEELHVAEEELRQQNQELAEARHAVEAEKARYQELFELAPDPYLVTDVHSVVLEANLAAEDLFGVPEGRLIGKPLALYVHPDHVREFRLRLPRIPEHVPQVWETVLQPRSGDRLDAEITTIATQEHVNRTTTVRWIIRNITAHKRAEATLAQQTAQLREQANLLNLTHETIIVRELEGKILFWNHEAEEMYGWTVGEALGQITHTLLKTRFPVSLDAVNATLEKNGRWEGELVHTRRDGSEFTVLSRQVLQRGKNGAPHSVLEINSDITAQKRSDEELRALNARLEQRVAERTNQLLQANLRVTTILNNITDSYIAFDREWRLIAINPVAERYLFRRPKEEMLGKVFWDLFPQSTETEFYKQYYRAVAEQQPVHFEGKSHIVDRWYEAHAYPTRLGLEVYLRDITMRKREEEARARLAAIIESSQDPIIGLDLDGKIQSWNPAAEQLFGYAAVEVEGRPISIIYPPESGEEFAATVAQLRRGERIEHFETVRLRKDGERVGVSVSISPIRDASGNLVGAAKIERDITAEKRARAAERFLSEASAALGSSLEYQATLKKVAHLAVPFLADYCMVEVIQEGQNPRQIICAAETLEQEALLDLVVKRALRDPNSGPLHRVCETRQPLVVWEVDDSAWDQIQDAELKRLLDTLKPCSYMSVPMVARGRAIGTITLAMGGSRRAYNANDLAIAQNLAERAALAIDNARLYFESQAAIVARDQFLSVASHEVRTPLTVIQGYTQLWHKFADRAAASGSDTISIDRAQMERTLANIEFATARLSTLIGDLLDVSRMRDHQLHITRERVNLNQLLRRVISGMRAHRDHREQTKSIDLKSDLPEGEVWGEFDPVRLEQVMENLVDNAIKYSPTGGRVRVKLSVEPSDGDDALQAHIAVRDEGIGIPGEEMGKIFQPFIRTSNATARHYPGLGLGLAVSREIVQRHGGRIWVESAGVDQGSTFHIVLPGVEMA